MPNSAAGTRNLCQLVEPLIRARAAGVPTDQPEIVALLALAHGLGSLAMEIEPELQNTYTEAARLVFDRLTAPKSLREGKSQC